MPKIGLRKQRQALSSERQQTGRYGRRNDKRVTAFFFFTWTYDRFYRFVRIILSRIRQNDRFDRYLSLCTDVSWAARCPRAAANASWPPVRRTPKSLTGHTARRRLCTYRRTLRRRSAAAAGTRPVGPTTVPSRGAPAGGRGRLRLRLLGRLPLRRRRVSFSARTELVRLGYVLAAETSLRVRIASSGGRGTAPWKTVGLISRGRFARTNGRWSSDKNTTRIQLQRRRRRRRRRR